MAQPTRLTAVNAYEVVVPCKPGAINSTTLEKHDRTVGWDRMPIVVLEATLDDGLTALGEVGRGHDLESLERWLRQLPGTVMRPNLTCQPAGWRAVSELETRHPPAFFESPCPALGALEMIALDWAGQRLGRPMVDLLGGPQREQVLVDYWCGRQTPDDLRSIVKAARRLGFTGLKMKSKHGDDVIAQVEAIREVAGDRFHITIDPMFQWFSPNDALLKLKMLEKFGEGIRIEDPFPQDMPDLWQRARQVCAVPLVWHARNFAVLRRALQDRCVDAINCGGGCNSEFLTMAHAVDVAGLSCWHGSGNELGVATVAQLHAAAAARCCVMHSDFASPLVREHTLIDWDWPFKDSHLPLPMGAGLGVTLDRAALERYTRKTLKIEN